MSAVRREDHPMRVTLRSLMTALALAIAVFVAAPASRSSRPR